VNTENWGPEKKSNFFNPMTSWFLGGKLKNIKHDIRKAEAHSQSEGFGVSASSSSSFSEAHSSWFSASPKAKAKPAPAAPAQTLPDTTDMLGMSLGDVVKATKGRRLGDVGDA